MWQECGGGPYTLIPPLCNRIGIQEVLSQSHNLCNMEDASTDDEQSDNAWSDDSDDNYENDEEV